MTDSDDTPRDAAAPDDTAQILATLDARTRARLADVHDLRLTRRGGSIIGTAVVPRNRGRGRPSIAIVLGHEAEHGGVHAIAWTVSAVRAEELERQLGERLDAFDEEDGR